MKFLADMGISMATVRALRETGEEVVHLRDQGLQRWPDGQIMEKAARERRTILTCDLDFGELLAASGETLPSVILVRMRNQTPEAVTPRLLQVLETSRNALESGAIIIVEDGGFRTRRLPIQRS